MNTQTQLIPQIIEDFKFTFHSDNGFLTYNKRATVKIKIGEVEENVEFTTRKDGWGDNVKYKTHTTLEYKFRKLIDSGAEIDYEFLEDEYVIQKEKEEKKDIILRTKTYKEEHRNWWAYQLNDIKTEGISVSIPTEEEYVNSKLNKGGTLKPTITYKGITNDIGYLNVSYTHIKTIRYCLQGLVTKRKRRNYSTLENLIEKFVQLAEFKIASDKADKIAKENIRLQQESILKHLTNVFGELITTQTEYQRKNFPNTKTLNNFYINIDDRDCPIMYREKDDDITYNFLGQQNLTENQVKGLIEGLKNK